MWGKSEYGGGGRIYNGKQAKTHHQRKLVIVPHKVVLRVDALEVPGVVDVLGGVGGFGLGGWGEGVRVGVEGDERSNISVRFSVGARAMTGQARGGRADARWQGRRVG